MIRTGHMTEQLTVQYRTRTSDGQGGGTPTWDTLITGEWASVSELSNSRAMLEGGIQFTKAIEITMRASNVYSWSGEYRILWDSQYWTIYDVTVNDDVRITAYTK